MARLYPCINCNSELARGANFCDKCGNPTAGSLWTAVQQLEDKILGIGKSQKKIKKKISTSRRKSVSQNKGRNPPLREDYQQHSKSSSPNGRQYSGQSNAIQEIISD